MENNYRTGDGSASRLLPQSVKQQTIELGDMRFEMAYEFDDLRNLKPKRERMNPNERRRK